MKDLKYSRRRERERTVMKKVWEICDKCRNWKGQRRMVEEYRKKERRREEYYEEKKGFSNDIRKVRQRQRK